MAKTINISALDEQFKKDCKVIDLKYEYTDYIGSVRWAVITDLTETEIFERYPEQINPYTPFIVLSPAFGEVRDEFMRSENKHRMRAARSVDAFCYDDELTAVFHPELVADTLEAEFLLKVEADELWAAIEKLPEIQKRRLIKRYFRGMSSRAIAQEEGVNYSKIDKSIAAALNSLKKYFLR